MRLSRAIVGLVALLATAPARAADDSAVAAVRALYASFEAAVKNGLGDARTRADAIRGPIAATFDFPAMTRVAVGAKWKSLTPEQQGALTEAFGPFFTATYATRLAQAAGGTFAVVPPSVARSAGRVVHTEVASASGDASDVDYLVGPENRVQDVYLNGNVSEIAAMRASFSEPLKTGGADGLLKFLRERTTGMLAAKPTP